MIKSFACFENKTYKYNEEVVSVISTKPFGGQIHVVYLDKAGEKQDYIADNQKEFDEDFKQTDEVYIAPKKKKAKAVKKAKAKDDEKDEYNLVYYHGKRKAETIRHNITKKLAYSLKNSKYKNHPDYKLGRIEVEPVTPQKVSEKKELGMIPGYTDPNKDNKNYNWDAVPKRDVKKNEGPNMLKISEIGVGDRDPIKKFKEWDGQYWLQKKRKAKKS